MLINYSYEHSQSPIFISCLCVHQIVGLLGPIRYNDPFLLHCSLNFWANDLSESLYLVNDGGNHGIVVKFDASKLCSMNAPLHWGQVKPILLL